MESGIGKMIQVIRGKQVLLDRDLATLYGVETKRINEQVKRNIERFPEDFCIQLSLEESQLLRSQNATLEKKGQNLKGKHTKYRSLAFTEQGVAMLSSVLKSETAIKVNIAIMRAFVQLRHLMMGNGGLINRLSNVEAKDLEQDSRLTGHDEHLLDHDRKFDELFEAMDRGELKTKGLFYNNQEFDAYVFVCDLIRQAKKRIVLVDRYVNEKKEVVKNFDHLAKLKYSPVNPTAFTERGLYMLATILKGRVATQTTINIINTFVRK